MWTIKFAFWVFTQLSYYFQEEELKNSLNQTAKDPYLDTALLEHFVVEVEKFEKMVDGLCKQTLNGPTPIEKEWKVRVDTIKCDYATWLCMLHWHMHNIFIYNVPVGYIDMYLYIALTYTHHVTLHIPGPTTGCNSHNSHKSPASPANSHLLPLPPNNPHFLPSGTISH